MKQILIIIFLCIQGCSVKPLPTVIVPENAKIGVMYLLDDKPKHEHVGITLFSYFEKNDASDWGIKADFNYIVNSQINKYSVVNVEPSQKLIENRLDIISSDWNSFYFNSDLLKEMTSVTSGTGIDFLVTLEPFLPPEDYSPTGDASGYGLYTRCGFESCKAWALKSVAVRVYAMNPPRLIAEGYSSEENLPLDINFSPDINKLPISEIDKAKQPFINYFHEIVISALQKSNLTKPGSIESDSIDYKSKSIDLTGTLSPIRVTPEKKALYIKAAGKAQLSVSDWIKSLADQEIKRDQGLKN